MKLSSVNFVFKTKILFSEITEDKELSKEWLVVREPTATEFSKFSEDGAENMTTLRKLLPKCIVESSFTDDDGNPATGEAIGKMLDESATLTTAITEKWMSACPFHSLKEKSEN